MRDLEIQNTLAMQQGRTTSIVLGRNIAIDKSFEAQEEGEKLDEECQPASTSKTLHHTTEVKSSIVTEDSMHRPTAAISKNTDQKLPVSMANKRRTQAEGAMPKLADLHNFASLVDPRTAS